MVRHETLGYGDALKKYEFNLAAPELKKKGQVNCRVWTVGNDYPDPLDMVSRATVVAKLAQAGVPMATALDAVSRVAPPALRRVPDNLPLAGSG